MLKIAYYRIRFIGDSVIALDSIYAIKALYPSAFLSIYTGDIGEMIFSHFDFIDEIVNIQNLSNDKIVDSLNYRAFDYLILTQPNRRHTRIASASNAKVVISFAMWHNLFRRCFGKRQFRRVFYTYLFSSDPHYKRLLALVRKIDSAHYDNNFDIVMGGGNNIRFTPSPTHRKFVEFKLDFLCDSQKNTPKILINPYANSCPTNLTLQGYARLAQKLAIEIPHAHIIISSFEGATALPFITPKPRNIHIFTNNNDLWNLIELVRSVDLLISPSTGTIHIADNLAIPLIGLYNKKDMRLWLGKNMDKSFMVLLKTPTNKLKIHEENKLIDEILQKTIKYVCDFYGIDVDSMRNF